MGGLREGVTPHSSRRVQKRKPQRPEVYCALSSYPDPIITTSPTRRPFCRSVCGFSCYFIFTPDPSKQFVSGLFVAIPPTLHHIVAMEPECLFPLLPLTYLQCSRVLENTPPPGLSCCFFLHMIQIPAGISVKALLPIASSPLHPPPLTTMYNTSVYFLTQPSAKRFERRKVVWDWFIFREWRLHPCALSRFGYEDLLHILETCRFFCMSQAYCKWLALCLPWGRLHLSCNSMPAVSLICLFFSAFQFCPEF